jgi:mono/diheme cytochrome c family protein
MQHFSKYLIAALLIAVLVSCTDETKIVDAKDDRSLQYFPQMYRDVGYSTYEEGEIFPNNMAAQKPVEGSISRGWMPYEYEDSNEGYASAKANLTNPLPYTEENLTNGQALYTIYCAICHGKKGAGQGHLVKTEKILGVPAYDAREITQGSIYHVLYYGINTMGSYASQTTEEERWQIGHYVDKLRRELKGMPEREYDSLVNYEAAEKMADTVMALGPRDKDSEVEEDALQPGEIEDLDEEKLREVKEDSKNIDG